VAADASAKAASPAAAQALAHLQTPGSDPHASLLTVAQWLCIWIASRVSLQPATLRNYTAHIDSYLIPHLGGVPLRELSIRDVQRMFTTIMRRGTITRPSGLGDHAHLPARHIASRAQRRRRGEPPARQSVPLR
jgi:hypothetical protein